MRPIFWEIQIWIWLFSQFIQYNDITQLEINSNFCMNPVPDPHHQSIELRFEQQGDPNPRPIVNQPNKQIQLTTDPHPRQYHNEEKQPKRQQMCYQNLQPQLQEKREDRLDKHNTSIQPPSNSRSGNKTSLLTDKLNKKDTPKSQSSDKSSSLLICIEDSEVIPTVFLQSSPKGHKFISVKVPMYRTTTFMKMETQIFIIEITKPGATKDYQIQRRYSDFVELYEALFYNHPGYILAPFPGKGLESFIKIKLGLGTHEPGERCEMIQKRMLDLEKFLNFVTHHRQLCNSEELNNFITQDPQVYQEGKKRLQKYVNQNRSLEKGSQLKNIIGIGKSLWNSYIKHQQKPKKTEMTLGKNDIQFGVILETVRTEKQRTTEKFLQCSGVYTAQKSLSEFVDMPTENDMLLKLCTKHTSGKQYSKIFADYIEINVLDHYKYNIRKFQQIQKSLLFRIQILECLKEAREEGNLQKKQKLSRRLEMFERNFFNDWENVFVEIEKNNKSIHEGFLKQWKNQKKLLKKIWKPINKN